MHVGGLLGPEHVLPDRVARRGVVERRLRRLSLGRRARRRKSRFAFAVCSAVHSTAAAAAAEKVEVSSSPSTARSWLPTRQTSQRSRDQLDAGVGLGAVADDVAEAPELLDAGLVAVAEDRLEGGQIGVDVAEDCYAHERRRTAARRVGAGPGRVYRRCGCLGADLRCARSAPRGDSRHDRRDRHRRRSGGRVADASSAPTTPDPSRSRSGARLLRPRRRPTRARTTSSGQLVLFVIGTSRSSSPRWPRSRSGARGRCAGSRRRLGRRPVLGAAGPGPASRCCSRCSPCRPGDRPRALGRLRPLHAGARRAGSATRSAARRSPPCSRRRGDDPGRPAAAAAAPLVARRHRVVIVLRRRQHLARAGRPRADLQRLRPSFPPGRARHACSSSPTAPGSRSATSTRSTPRRRSTGVNAYVDGIGSSRRIVLYDNLLDRADGPVLRSIVAHELGHVAHEDLRRGLTFVAIIAPLGMLLVAVAGTALADRGGSRPGTPAAIPAYALLIAVVGFGLNLAGNQLSRRVEASADRFALELTHDPRGFIELQQRLVAANHSDPDPPGRWQRSSTPTRLRSSGSARRLPMRTSAGSPWTNGGSPPARESSEGLVRVAPALHPDRRNPQ